MPPGTRATRHRVESDENSTRPLTRAKTAALNIDELAAMPTKGTLQPKNSAANLGNAAARAKRSALTDMSNVNKLEATEGKKVGGKGGLISKAHPVGVQKSTTRSTTTRATIAAKELKKKPEIRRNGPGFVPAASTVPAATKRKAGSAVGRDAEDVVAEKSQPARKKTHKEKDDELALSDELALEDRALDDRAPSDWAFHRALDRTLDDRTTIPKLPAVPILEEVKAEIKIPEEVEKIEEDDWDDPLMVAEYATEIFEYLRDLEGRSIPHPQYMDHQDDLEWKTRGILIDWLVEVHTRFHLLPETLFLAVNIIDRFLSAKVVQLDRLQLVGITAMFIASKYEEVLSPHVENFRRITDNGFSEAEILSAERFLLSTLDYDLSYPNPMNFLRRVSKADNYDIQSRTIGKYLMEISLLDHRFMAYRPSHCAAAAMYLARMMLDRGAWDDLLSYYAGYNKQEVQPIVDLMIDYLARPVVHEAFFKKYASKKFLKASILARSWAKKNAFLFGITDTELSLDQIS